jgi:hypothetical protein
VLYPVERQTATVRFDGMVFGCSAVQRHGNRWIAVGTQSRTYTNRGRNLGAFILDRYSPNYEGTYTPTVGVYEWIGAGERITPENASGNRHTCGEAVTNQTNTRPAVEAGGSGKKEIEMVIVKIVCVEKASYTT